VLTANCVRVSKGRRDGKGGVRERVGLGRDEREEKEVGYCEILIEKFRLNF